MAAEQLVARSAAYCLDATLEVAVGLQVHPDASSVCLQVYSPRVERFKHPVKVRRAFTGARFGCGATGAVRGAQVAEITTIRYTGMPMTVVFRCTTAAAAGAGIRTTGPTAA